MQIEEIVSQVKQKLGQTSLSDRSITEYFTAVNHQGEPDDAFYEQHVKVLKSFGGQYNHDIAEWKKQYEAEHPKQTPPAPEEPKPTEMNPEVKALLDKQNEQIAALTALVTSQQKKQTAEQMKAAALEYGTTLKAEKPELWKSAVGFTTITDGMTAEQYNAAVKSTYETLNAAAGNGNQPYGQSGGGGSTDRDKKDIDDFFARKFGTSDKK